MTKISELPIAATIDGTEYFPHVQDGVTKRSLISKILDLIWPYKLYSVILNQSGEVAPVPIVQQKTINENFSFEYQGAGVYYLTKDGGDFDPEKTQVFIGTATSAGSTVNCYMLGTGIYINTTKSGSPADNVLVNCAFEIRIKN